MHVWATMHVHTEVQQLLKVVLLAASPPSLPIRLSPGDGREGSSAEAGEIRPTRLRGRGRAERGGGRGRGKEPDA